MLRYSTMLKIICVWVIICLLPISSTVFAGTQGPDADGTIMYSQDFENNMDGCKKSPSGLPDSRVTRVADPLGQRGTVLKLLWQSGDDYRTSSGTNPRTEINVVDGYEWPRNQIVSIAWGQRFDTSVINATIAQVIGDNGPYWMLNADGTGKLSVMGVTGGSDFNYTLKTNQWNDFKVEWKGSTTNAYFKMWINGVQVLNKTGLSFSRSTVNMHTKFGIYNRDAGVEENNTRNCYLSNISIGNLSVPSTPTPVPTPTHTPGLSMIANLSVKDTANAADWSIQKNLQAGNTEYGDRTFTFTSVPSIVAGAEWVRTANDSKMYTTDPLVTFTVVQAADVYVAHNDMITAKPSWLSGWTDTGADLVNNESTPRTYSLYKKSYAANSTVSLGSNGDTSQGMYTVIVTTASTPTPTPTPTPIPTPTPTPVPGQSIITDLLVSDTANAADWSIQSNLQPGNTEYGDRTYTFTSVPSTVAGAEWIRTANDSKAYIGAALASFTVTRDCTVYVAHIDKITTKPSWLSGWTDSGSDLVDDEATPYTFSLYRKSYTANSTVTLGDNGSTSWGMYTVIVKPVLITNLSVNDTANAADWSIQNNLQPGNNQYGDRTYAFTSVPATVAGADWIRTAADSRTYTGSTLVTFTVNKDCDVYVAHSDSIEIKPSWLDNWVDSGYDLVNNESNPKIFSLYMKAFAAGSIVSFGDNGDTGSGMYTIIVKAR